MGCSRSRFEDLCEEQYNRCLRKAKREIDADDFWGCEWIRPEIYSPIDFPSYEAHESIRRWNEKLRNEVEDYKRWHDNEQQEQEHRELRLEAERKRAELEAEERRELAEGEAEERRARQHENNRRDSLATLSAAPYLLTAAQAENFIQSDGLINKSALQHYVNSQRNREQLEKLKEQGKPCDSGQHPTPAVATICHSCGKHNPDIARFCSSCGTVLKKVCNSCNTLLPHNAMFCSKCGNKLSK